MKTLFLILGGVIFIVAFYKLFSSGSDTPQDSVPPDRTHGSD